jgi:hypothetical protein
MDKDLAAQINEVAHRMMDCEDGRLFDSKHGLRRRAKTPTYGQVLCSSQGVITMAGKGGPLADLILVSHDKIRMQLANSAPLAKKALVELQGFILLYSPLLSIPPQLLEQLGTLVVALVVDTLILDKLPIGPINVIRPELAITYGAMSPKPTPTSASATSSASACPDPSKTPVRGNPLLRC